MRSAIYNIYRLPLNGIVITALMTKLDTQTTFLVTSFMLLVAALAQTKLIGLRKAGAQGAGTYKSVSAAQPESGEPVVFGRELGLDEDSDEEKGPSSPVCDPQP